VTDVVATPAQAATLQREPLVVLEPLQRFLEDAGLAAGPISVRRIGDGHSNITYAIAGGSQQWVLRRPPRGPLPPSAHDVLREARLLDTLSGGSVRVPEVVAVCDDPQVIGAPFYVMPFITGDVLTTQLPSAYVQSQHPKQIAAQLVEALVELHAVDTASRARSGLSHGEEYLERQLRRFRGLLERNATRPLPELAQVADWLDANRPSSSSVTMVHGDYRLGNTIFTAHPRPRLVAILDWEMATLGDPLADIGYMTAMWAEADDPEDPMLALSRVTRLPGFPSREWLAERYARDVGVDRLQLDWYQTLAMWKSAIFLESSYKRFRDGTTDDRYFAGLREGVPALARRALRSITKS
jgi:aminoglycoside phosphotransferase (APT) family kinase protein